VNPFDLFKNMETLQNQMKSMQGKLDNLRATGSSGAGMVEVTVNGKMEIISLSISKEIVDPNDIKTLEVLVAAAFNAAAAEVQELLKQEALSLSGRQG